MYQHTVITFVSWFANPEIYKVQMFASPCLKGKATRQWEGL